MRDFFVRIALFAAIAAASVARGQTIQQRPLGDVDFAKPPAFGEALEAAKAFELPRGLEIKVFAAEPQLVSPVAISTDHKGRLYVVETFRAWGNGGMDMRFYMPWLDDDLAARTVEDRVSWVTRRAGESAKNLTLDSDRVRLLEDKDGDGRADSATVFTDNYRAVEDGIAAGVLPRRDGGVYFANIPRLYDLKDTDNDGKADQRQVMHSGFGVHYQFLGHDLHGLIMGPDGKLYFSVGDRGAHVKTREGKTLENPDSGAVFRCDPDGSNLEIVHSGLRNPQELAFDKYGNLFTGDNNCDMGDLARWVYVVEGGDSGWRCGYQYIREPNPGGPWLAEKLWHLDSDHPAAWALPPVGHAVPGPSGLAYYPGTGLGDKYENQFFLCDFRGGTNSGVWTFGLRPKGASFEIGSRRQFLWNVLPTDVEFAVDGGLYVSDWVNGWFRPMKGRIWKVTDPEAGKSTLVSETKALLSEGLSGRNEKDLVTLLAHRDQRVRLEAQFELARRTSDTILSRLHKLVSLQDADQLARIHAIWALGQLARKDPAVLEPVSKLLDDGDSEIRAQAAKVLGDAKYNKESAYDGLLKRLKDETPRVRFFAATALSKIGDVKPAATGAASGTPTAESKNAPKPPTPAQRVITMLRENDNRDAYLRHAGVLALLGLNDKEGLELAAKDDSPAVRLAALLVMRRARDPNVARFLEDPMPLVADEAARAIYDVPIEPATTKLASVINKKPASRSVWLRSISANLRLGTGENAFVLARLAGDDTASEEARVEALWALANWSTAPNLDRVLGLYRPVGKRDARLAAEAASPLIPRMVRDAPPGVRVAAVRVIEKLRVHVELLDDLVQSRDAPPMVRAAALRAMASLNRPGIVAAINTAFEQGRGTILRRTAISFMMRLSDAKDRVGPIFTQGDLADRKAVLEALAFAPPGVGDSILATGLQSLLENSLPPELHLDLLEAAANSKSPEVAAALKSFEQKRDKNDPLSNFTETLAGGDAARGRRVFLEKGSTACLRCHKIGTDAVVVGPDLAGIGAKKDRRYLLEAIIKPNAQIAPGFESVILTMKDGDTVSGTLKKETDTALHVEITDEGVTEISKSEIAERRKTLSAMPEGLEQMLNRREIRDIVEFLASLKDEKQVINPTRPADPNQPTGDTGDE